MIGLIASAIGALVIAGGIWGLSSWQQGIGRDKQYAADQKEETRLKGVIDGCTKDKDTAVNENAKMQLSLKLYGDQVALQNKAIETMDAVTLALRKAQVAGAIKAQDKIRQLNAESLDLDAALRERRDTLSCPQQLADVKAMLAAGMKQQRRDHPVTREEASKVFGFDRPVTIKP